MRMRRSEFRTQKPETGAHCRGLASADYVLVIGVVFLLGGLSLVLSSNIMVLAYDMICALVSWPFL